MTISLPSEDKSFRSRTELLEDIIALLGGRAAEMLELGDISTGASNDLQRATAIARSMVSKYGMSAKLGLISLDESNEVFIGKSMGHSRSYSEAVAAAVDQEIREILDASMKEAVSRLERCRAQLAAVAEYLLENETMSSEEFERVCSEIEEA